MKHFSTLGDYCRGIGISPPKWDDFDTRSFEENMKSVFHQMPPFKHEFYAIALKTDGGGTVKLGNFEAEHRGATVFFNSPYQILSWDIPPDWQGFYVIFSEDFYREHILARRLDGAKNRITELFPFLLMDKAIPVEVKEEETKLFSKILKDIQSEFSQEESASKEVIAHYLHILLVKIRRLYAELEPEIKNQSQRNQDIQLVSRFKALIESSFQPGMDYNQNSPHQVQFYADKLNLHPGHFNSIVKRITDKSASEHIYRHVFFLAKSRLKNTSLSVKEIAFDLYYPYANHFASFFKTRAKMTPSEYRKSLK